MSGGGFKKSIFTDNDQDNAPCYTSKYTHDIDDTSEDLTGSFTDQYLYEGSGKFIGFVIEFDHKDVEVKFSIDGDIVLQVEPDLLSSHGNVSMQENLDLKYEPNKKLLTFYPKFPICFDTEVRLEARETAGEHSRVYYMVAIEKVT